MDKFIPWQFIGDPNYIPQQGQMAPMSPLIASAGGSTDALEGAIKKIPNREPAMPQIRPQAVVQREPQASQEMPEDDLASRFRELMKERMGGVEGMQKQIQNLDQNPTQKSWSQVDFSPALAWAAHMSGNQGLLSSYKGPTKKPSDQEIKDKLRDAIAKEQAGLSNDYLQLMSMDQRNKDRAADEEYRRQMLGIERAKMDAQGGKLSLTPGQEVVDKTFGKEYAGFVAAGGSADLQKNLEQLDSVIERLEETNVSRSMLPLAMRDYTDPEGAAIQQQVEEIIQRNLKAVLGGQFSEKEGKQLIERAYNPRQPRSENLRRLKRVMGQIEQTAQAKLASAKHFERYGTLSDYNGSEINASALYNMTFDDAKQAKSTPKKVSGGFDAAPDFDTMSEDELMNYLGQ